jgi:DNA-binding IclR family transcriptional regulator
VLQPSGGPGPIEWEPSALSSTFAISEAICQRKIRYHVHGQSAIALMDKVTISRRRAEHSGNDAIGSKKSGGSRTGSAESGETGRAVTSGGRRRGIQSVDVGHRLLSALVDAGRPMILRDLAEAAGLAPAQAHAYLASFRRIELVEQSPTSGHYSLGPFAMHLGMARMRSSRVLAAASEAAIELSARIGLMVCVVVWGPHAPTVIQVQEGRRQLDLNIREGTIFSVTGTASGRLFGALMETQAVKRRIEAELKGSVINQNRETRTKRENLEATFAAIRSAGFAESFGRPVPGINAIAAPVFDADGKLALVLTLIGSSGTLPLAENDTARKLLLGTVHSLSNQAVRHARDEPDARSKCEKLVAPTIAVRRNRPEAQGRGVQSIEVGARLLDALVEAGAPMMLRDLARQAGIPPAQAHAYLVSFRNSALVEQDGQAGLYRLGPFALDLAITRMRSFDPLRMAGEATAELAKETGLTVALSVWGTFGPTVIQVSEGADQVHITTKVGTVYSVAGTATGRVFAAFLPESLVRETIKAEQAEIWNVRRIGRTVSYRALKPDLTVIRAAGVATIKDPPVPGINALSAPIFDHVGQMQMAVTLIGPAESLDSSLDSPLVPVLLAFTSKLSARLGYRSRA